MTTTTTTTSHDGATPGKGAPIIEAVGLTKTYPGTDFRALDELNLRVDTDERKIGLSRKRVEWAEEDAKGDGEQPPGGGAAPGKAASTPASELKGGVGGKSGPLIGPAEEQ